MKKIALLLAAATLTVGLVSCTGGDDNGSTSNDGTTAAQTVTYKDGTYRGAFYDASVVVEISLKDNKVESAKFRTLKYKEEDYLKTEDATLVALKGQYEDVLNYIVGKDITTVVDELYTPENITKDIDGFTAATVRSGKIISAINDALNRGVYSLPKAE